MATLPSPHLSATFRFARNLSHRCRIALPPTSSHLRAFSSEPSSLTTSTSSDPPSAPPAPHALAPLPHRRLIHLRGPDAPKFLNGLITASLPLPALVPAGGAHTTGAGQSSIYAAFLTAQGRVLADCFVHPVAGMPAYRAWAATATDTTTESSAATVLRVGVGWDDWACFVEVDAGVAAEVERHLRRHKLRARVAVEAVPGGGEGGGWSVWSAWPVSQSPSPPSSSPTGASVAETADPSFLLAPDTRAPHFGFRALTPPSPAPASASSSGSAAAHPPDSLLSHLRAAPAPPAAYTARRYAFGLPEGPHELAPLSALPLEANLEYTRAVDFAKGCYVGQELTVRTRHRGVVRKRVLPVEVRPAPTAAADTGSSGPESGKGVSGEEKGPPPQAEIRRVEDAAASASASAENVWAGAGRRAVGRLLGVQGGAGLALCRLEAMAPEYPEPSGGDGAGDRGGDAFEARWADEHGGGVCALRVRAWVPAWHREREAVLVARKKGGTAGVN